MDELRDNARNADGARGVKPEQGRNRETKKDSARPHAAQNVFVRTMATPTTNSSSSNDDDDDNNSNNNNNLVCRKGCAELSPLEHVVARRGEAGLGRTKGSPADAIPSTCQAGEGCLRKKTKH